jgi:serine/threonine protein kinase
VTTPSGQTPSGKTEEDLRDQETREVEVRPLHVVEPPPVPLPSPRLLERGATIGRYVVLEPLGEGGMGLVYSAYDPKLDRRVAVKVLRAHAGATSDAGTLGSGLLREAQAMARLSHPNIVPVHDAGSVDGQVFVAMELIEGKTLSQWLRERPRPWRLVLEKHLDAARGLAAAHAAGIVHRDFKPANVLVRNDGRVLVTDFGLARSISRSVPVAADGPAPGPGDVTAEPDRRADPLTRGGMVMGTPEYMSPEHRRGEEVTEKGDQFSFCVALYEALFGHRPGGSEWTKPGERPRVRSGATHGTPSLVRRALLRGLRESPDERFASMDALLEALTVRWWRSARTRAAVAAGCIVAVGTGTAVALAPTPIEQCRQLAGGLGQHWTPELKHRLGEAFAATGRS